MQLTCRKGTDNSVSTRAFKESTSKPGQGKKGSYTVPTLTYSLYSSHIGYPTEVSLSQSPLQSTLGVSTAQAMVRDWACCLRRESRKSAEQSLTQLSIVGLDSGTSLVFDCRDSGQLTSKVSSAYLDIPFTRIPWTTQSCTQMCIF